MTSDRLEERLFDLGAALWTPTAPDLVPAVMARLPEPRAVRARRAGLRFHRPRRALALSLGTALLLSGTAMAVPPSRDAILSVLGLRGVRIERVSRPPAPERGSGWACASRSTGPVTRRASPRSCLRTRPRPIWRMTCRAGASRSSPGPCS